MRHIGPGDEDRSVRGDGRARNGFAGTPTRSLLAHCGSEFLSLKTKGLSSPEATFAGELQVLPPSFDLENWMLVVGATLPTGVLS